MSDDQPIETPEESADEIEGVAFGEALEQLEEILRGIEDDEIDIDRLAEELRKATRLLELCRGKIRKAEVEVRQIVDQLD